MIFVSRLVDISLNIILEIIRLILVDSADLFLSLVIKRSEIGN